jgi:glutathione S-transferase
MEIKRNSLDTKLDMTTKEDNETTSNLFKFYTLKGGMCPYAARTWMTLLELGLPFEIIDVSPMNKEDWYLEINPRGKVPALENIKDGSVIYESAICDEYLSDLAREMDKDGPSEGKDYWKLMPINSSQRAALRLLNDHVDNDLSPVQFTFLMNKETEKDKKLTEKLEMALDVLEQTLVSNGGPFLMGYEFSLADVHLLPFFLRLKITLKHYKDYDIPKERFARLLDWFELCSERQSVKETVKSKEQIIEVYNRFVEANYAFGGLNKNAK